jgi:hypothetical protein
VRSTLHLVAAQVLGRRRFQVTGHFGLRATPGGFGTPAFGDETLRVAGGLLVREIEGTSRRTALDGATLRGLASFAGADLEAAFSAGDGAPEVGDPDAALPFDLGEAERLARWFALGWVVLDTVLGGLPPSAAPSTIQLWPEHFDAGVDVGLPSGDRVNLGFSPGDGYEPSPYVYVGPWSAARPGDPDYWNAPFGAVLRAAEVGGVADVAASFIRTGLAYASAP